MRILPFFSGLSRVLALGVLLAFGAQAQSDPLPSWNDGAARQAIVTFVNATTTPASPRPYT